MKSSKHVALSALAIAALVTAGTAQAANLLNNGSFEDADILDGTYTVSNATGWTGTYYVMDPNAAGGLPNVNPAWPQAFDDQQYVDIGNSTGFSLSQSFNVASAGAYRVTWADHTALGFDPSLWSSVYQVSLTGPSAITVGGTTFNALHANGNWGQRNEVVNLLAGNYTLSFQAQGSSTLDALIDNVSITAVPEPGTWALLLAGIVTVGSVARRRIG